MIKFRLYFDKDKEETFLNNMVNKGYAMDRFFLGIYWFEECERGEYIYRIDLIRDKTTQEKNEFYDLIRETGGELVQTWGVWAFFRKKGSFELYTDTESKIEQYGRIRKTFMILAFFELFIALSQWNSFLSSSIKSALAGVIITGFLGIILFLQVYKCSVKMKELKNK